MFFRFRASFLSFLNWIVSAAFGVAAMVSRTLARLTKGLRHGCGPGYPFSVWPCLIASVLLLAVACQQDDEETTKQDAAVERAGEGKKDSRPPPMSQPVPMWVEGKQEKNIDAATAREDGYALVDLADDWTPYLFTERGNESEERVPNAYRKTYLALANGAYPDDHHGERARRDKYLELYGIAPTFSLLRERFLDTQKRGCEETIADDVFANFDGFVSYKGNAVARRKSQRFPVLKRQIDALVKKFAVERPEALADAKLSTKDQRLLNEYLRLEPEHTVVTAAQERLRCGGFLEGKGSITPGALDWVTHEALAEFERRHRVYAWGYIGRETLDKLRQSPLLLEQEAVIRVLTERAMHAAGVIEDGSAPTSREGRPPSFRGKDGKQHEVPNLEKALRTRIVKAFGLHTPEKTLAWLKGLEKLDEDGPRWVAFKSPAFPEYYDGNMDLAVSIYRGDVWYEFPIDAEGKERGQPVGSRPRLTVYTTYLDQRIPLARFGTTIGGWRTEMVDGVVMWKYKNSPTGPRVWKRIAASPVWIPPEGTPPKSLLKRVGRGSGKNAYEVNYHEIGPSYASAYGLVAAYHLKYAKGADGSIRFGGDEGIRSHGSVDYMSIMRRFSHGCHRLHNHIAVRLMSFVLAHRPHKRVGQQKVAMYRELPVGEHTYTMSIREGGYDFELEDPLPVQVLEGRIRGRVRSPITTPLPRFNEELGAFIMPDGSPVAVDFAGRMTPIELPDMGLDGLQEGIPGMLPPGQSGQTPGGGSMGGAAPTSGGATKQAVPNTGSPIFGAVPVAPKAGQAEKGTSAAGRSGTGGDRAGTMRAPGEVVKKPAAGAAQGSPTQAKPPASNDQPASKENRGSESATSESPKAVPSKAVPSTKP